MTRPLAVDLFCGVGGWTEGLIEEGYEPIGFDIERHVYGDHAYPAQLVIQDVRTLHGSQIKEAALIVASPPCQEYSYMAMPWTRAKDKAAAIRADETGVMIAELNALFNACFRIQREASEAVGHHIPMVVENVRGAIPWVGRSRWNFSSYHLWGDVPALMPITLGRKAMKVGIAHRANGETNFHGHKVSGISFSGYGDTDYKAIAFNGEAARRFREEEHLKGLEIDGRKCGGAWFGEGNDTSFMRRHSSKSNARKAASAMIAKIPFPLACHIARVWKPERPFGSDLFG